MAGGGKPRSRGTGREELGGGGLMGRGRRFGVGGGLQGQGGGGGFEGEVGCYCRLTRVKPCEDWSHLVYLNQADPFAR